VILWLQYENYTVPYRNVKLVVDREGRTVTDAQFRGSWLLVYFGYTLCPEARPSDIDPACARRSRRFSSLSGSCPRALAVYVVWSVSGTPNMVYVRSAPILWFASPVSPAVSGAVPDHRKRMGPRTSGIHSSSVMQFMGRFMKPNAAIFRFSSMLPLLSASASILAKGSSCRCLPVR
jgi:hypothetical protein